MENLHFMEQKLNSINKTALGHKSVTIDDLININLKINSFKSNNNYISTTIKLFISLIFTILLAIFFNNDILLKTFSGVRCIIPNNYLIWEATRPETDCNMCKDINQVLIFNNISRDLFKNYEYSPRPMIAKRAAFNWPAMRIFDFNFFKNLYDSTQGSYESIEEECQILTFKSDFNSLKDVFSMNDSRIKLLAGEKPWYVGWSNCHPEILSEMRKYYEIPKFLPENAEHARRDYIFIGYNEGAVMHIDYISRLMWQAQIKGHKTWRVVPPPECEHICNSFSFKVHPGDIVLLDTRQWYHTTRIDSGELSLTISSEYG